MKKKIEKIIKMMDDCKDRLNSRSKDLDVIATISIPATREVAENEVDKQVNELVMNLIKVLSDEIK